MQATPRQRNRWKHYSTDAITWLYGALPLLPEVLNLNSKAAALFHAWRLVSRNGTKGDYVEFGVFQGDTFKLSMRVARRCFKSRPVGTFPGRFIACDSFQGLPEAPSMDEPDNCFHEGQYACPLDTFKRNIASAAGDSTVIVVDGWFSNTLTPKKREELKLTNIAIANIDCDIYESAVTCLEFMTPAVGNGTLLMFDDFFSNRGSMKSGEARALEEWLKANRTIKLIPFQKYAAAGMMFLVNLTDADSPFYLPSTG